MTSSVRTVALLGSTGSIGQNALAVIRACPDELAVGALAAHTRFAELVAQAREFRPRWVVAAHAERARAFDWSELPAETELLLGPEGLARVAAAPEVDVVLAAIVGAAGLHSAWAALEAGKTLALANKETLVVAGPLATRLAQQRGARLLPVDSEHSALFQALCAGRRDEVRRLILTASGGPFREFSHEQLAQATKEQALRHPTWNMGPKITIDSATMMNKALEIIEARWLFDVPAEQIAVVVHPQSIVHSLVEFVDGSVLAQLSPPDMKLPIQYALTYPRRRPGPAARLDFRETWRLDFTPPDPARFPALELGEEVARRGGTAGAVLNAANEAAVAAFLNDELRFAQIAEACGAVLRQHHFDPNPTLEQLLRLDAWARKEIARWISA